MKVSAAISLCDMQIWFSKKDFSMSFALISKRITHEQFFFPDSSFHIIAGGLIHLQGEIL